MNGKAETKVGVSVHQNLKSNVKLDISTFYSKLFKNEEVYAYLLLKCFKNLVQKC